MSLAQPWIEAIGLTGTDERGERLGQIDGLRQFRMLGAEPGQPLAVGGIALLYTFGRRGLLGRSLEVAGVEVAFSTTAVCSPS